MKSSKSYRLNINIQNPELCDFLYNLGYGQRRELIELLLSFIISHKEGNDLSYHQTIDLIRRSFYESDSK